MKSVLFSSTTVNFSPNLFASWFLLLFILHSETRAVQSIPIQRELELTGQKKPSELKSCDFNGQPKDHSVSDLLRCTDSLAKISSSIEFSKELDGIFQKLISRSRGRQGLGFPYPGRPHEGNYYGPGGPTLDNFGSGFYGGDGPQGYPGPYDSSGTLASGLVDALTSISQYDDLKCVPRLLCEIATGSRPGDGEYKASTFEDFGKNTLIGLLTSYNLEDASPVLAFGKAALLGYTSRGDSSVCYEEYVRCPRDPRDLVYYLNNHNGGFFRFFKNSGGRPVAQGSNRIGHALKEQAPPPGLSGPESDRTGTGELIFDTPEPSPRHDDQKSLFRLSSDSFSKVVFPEDDKPDYVQSEGSKNRAPKSLQTSSSLGFFPAPSKIEPSFFPSDNEDDLQKTTVVFESGENFRGGRSYDDQFEKESLSVSDQEIDEGSVVRFPDRGESVSFDLGVSKLFPFN